MQGYNKLKYGPQSF